MSTGHSPKAFPSHMFICMSRVERRAQSQKWEGAERRREPIGRTPSKAEGEEETVNEALRNQEKQRNAGAGFSPHRTR